LNTLSNGASFAPPDYSGFAFVAGDYCYIYIVIGTLIRAGQQIARAKAHLTTPQEGVRQASLSSSVISQT
jgi:hypothetical protein